MRSIKVPKKQGNIIIPSGDAYIARVDGTREVIKTPVSLEVAQKIVGGYVERVCPAKSPGVIFLCNEDGWAKGLLVNQHGTELYGIYGRYILGDIIVFTTKKAAKGWV